MNTSPPRQVLTDETPTSMIDLTQAIEFQEPITASCHQIAAREARFVAMVERQSRFVFRVVYALLRNPHDAEDAVQETFLKIYRAGAWDAIQNERAFLSRVAWRMALDKLKSGNRATNPLDPEIASRSAPNPEEAALTADWNATVQRLVDALPPELRQPLALSTLEEMNSREIAEIIGIAEGTVRTRLMRARHILKQKLSGIMDRYDQR